MTDITIFKQGNSIIEVKCCGHTGYASEGEDIVCAALSSIVQTALLGLLSVVGLNVNYTTDEAEGALHFKLPLDISVAKRHDADIVLNTMLCGLSDINSEYSDYINLEVR